MLARARPTRRPENLKVDPQTQPLGPNDEEGGLNPFRPTVIGSSEVQANHTRGPALAGNSARGTAVGDVSEGETESQPSDRKSVV